MIRLSFILATVITLVGPAAHAAGFQRIEVPASGQFHALEGVVWYPCAEPATPLKLGPFIMPVTQSCPVKGEKLPLVVISHGRGGTFLGHHDTAETLAEAGFVVVAINHPGDNAMDKSRTDDPSVFVERPADIKRTIDFMLGPWRDAETIDSGRIGIFGFSRGGYTGLVAIGANPYFGQRLRLCEGKHTPICDQVHQASLPELAHETRIKAAVIADPLSVFFTPDSFAGVEVPVQLWSSERGGDGVTPESIAGLVTLLPTTAEFHVVPNSRHFAFLAPCSAAIMTIAPEICADPPGFDRVGFHKQFDAQVLAFFRRHLLETQQH